MKKSDNAITNKEHASTCDVRGKKRKCRKYEDSYLDFGFTSIEVNDEERPQCVICSKVLSAESMNPSKLRRHLQTTHPNMVDKPREYFSRKMKDLHQQKNVFTKQASVPKNALLASFKVAYRIAKCKKAHTIAEELILPAAVDMANIMIGENAGKLLSNIPLSNNTINRRIQHMAQDLNDQLIEKMKGNEFGLQLDEATDSNKDAHLICYVRFIDGCTIVEDLLFCKSITGSARAEDMFDILDTFMTENNLDWTKCIGVCTDGARSMSGQYGGLQALIRRKAPDCLWTHCIIHREVLASKSLSLPLNLVLECVINVVNYIKTRPLKARFFKNLCEDLGAEHTSLIYYCSSRWLSRGNVLSRTFELREEIYNFLKENDHVSANNFADPDFLLKLAYLCDIFEKLNALNVSLQGRNIHILKLEERISAFKKKLQIWKRKMNDNGGKDCFPVLQQYMVCSGNNVSHSMLTLFTEHLSQLTDWFAKYFPEDQTEKFAWIQDPFHVEAPKEFTSQEEETLIELSCDKSLKAKFACLDLTEFWISIKNEYPILSAKAMRVLIPFATSYLCEAGFSAVAVIKSKYRSKINVEKEMRVAVSSFIPRFEQLCSEQQAHPSH